jgi:hypothetical protein
MQNPRPNPHEKFEAQASKFAVCQRTTGLTPSNLKPDDAAGREAITSQIAVTSITEMRDFPWKNEFCLTRRFVVGL